MRPIPCHVLFYKLGLAVGRFLLLGRVFRKYLTALTAAFIRRLTARLRVAKARDRG
jgi:hypothetical protein